MATLILLADHAHNGLKPGLRPSSPHRRRLASRRGQTPSPGSHGSSRPPRLVASPVGLTLPHRLEGASRSRIPAYPVGVVGAALLTAPPLTRLRGRGARDRLGLPPACLQPRRSDAPIAGGAGGTRGADHRGAAERGSR